MHQSEVGMQTCMAVDIINWFQSFFQHPYVMLFFLEELFHIFLFLLFFLSQTLFHDNVVLIVDTTVTLTRTSCAYPVARSTTQRSTAASNQHTECWLHVQLLDLQTSFLYRETTYFQQSRPQGVISIHCNIVFMNIISNTTQVSVRAVMLRIP